MSSDVEVATLWETPPLIKEEGVKDAAEPTRRDEIASFMIIWRRVGRERIDGCVDNQKKQIVSSLTNYLS